MCSISKPSYREGDELTTVDGRRAVIESIEEVSVPEGITVYNLEDAIYHNYIADGIVVHNSDALSGFSVRLVDNVDDVIEYA